MKILFIKFQNRINKPSLFLLAAILCCLIPFGCKRDKRVLSPYAIVVAGNASDSLLLEMNRAMMTYVNPDILDSLVDAYCVLSEKEDFNNQYEHRRLYWKGNALFMHGEFEKGDSLRRLALEQCDSSKFPYDYRLYRMTVEQPSDFRDNSARYERYKSDFDFFKEAGDNVSAFNRGVLLMGLLNEAGMNREALKYALASDSLVAKTDFRILRENNRVNLASAYFACGDTVKAVATLNSLRMSGESYSIPSIAAIVEYNLFQMTNDTLALQRAWDIVRDKDELEKMRVLVAASLVNSGGNPDETQRRALELFSEYDFTPEEGLEISEAILKIGKSGDLETLANASDNYIRVVKRYVDAQRKSEVVSAETNELIREIEDRERLEKERIRERVWIGITIALVLIGIGVNVVYRHITRLKSDLMLRQLEQERLKREHIAKDLMLAERQKLNEQLQNKIEDLVKEKEIETETAEMITEIIEEVGTAKNISSDENEFLKRFIDIYPKVGKTGRKLALYIRKGFDTSQIAKEMNIRKESVIQGRWRLRTQMELSPDTDLDVVLRKI